MYNGNMLTVYTKVGCPWCDGVRDYLNKNDISFTEKNVSENEGYYREMFEKSEQTKAPTLDLDGKILPDAGVDEVKEFLKENKII